MTTIDLFRLVNLNKKLKKDNYAIFNYLSGFLKTLKPVIVSNKDRNFGYLGFLGLRKYNLRFQYLYNLRRGFMVVNNIKFSLIRWINEKDRRNRNKIIYSNQEIQIKYSICLKKKEELNALPFIFFILSQYFLTFQVS